MADLIERDSTIKLFCDDCCKRRGGVDVCDEKCQDISVLKSVPAVNRWIPCSERLPGRFDTVLLAILSKNGYGEPAYYVTIGGMKNGTEFESYTGEMAEGEKVTHWMPLPNEPEVTKDE